jgi:phosphatidylglycerol lysyltransferase
MRGRTTHSGIALGAQPAWDPSGWSEIIARRASLRAQVNRARNKGTRIHEWAPGRATAHPGLELCLQQWLETRPLPPLHFLVEPGTLERLFDRRVFVATQHGSVVAFLVASPVPRRSGWLIEQIIRGRRASNGTSEMLIDAAFKKFAREGASYVTLGLSPLSRRVPITVDEKAWPVIPKLLALARDHGRRFYNFDGLDAFKAKFLPDRWEPVFAYYNEPRFTPRALYAIVRAFSGRSVLLTLARGILRSLRHRNG